MEVEYVNEQDSEITIDNNYETNLPPIKKPRVHEEVFRPQLPPKLRQVRRKPVVSSNPVKPIDCPIDAICFASFEDYLQYKQQHG